MAAGSDTKATQTVEKVEDYLHLTEENINFKCAEGIPAKLLKFRAFHEKGFRVRIELNGKLYRGAFLEINESHSFAPENLTRKKGRQVNYKKYIARPVTYKKYMACPSGVTRTKNPNTFCRENFPRCFVDARNTIEARLRYGRDKKIPGFNSFLAPAGSPSQSKDDSVLKSNRKKKSHSVVEGSDSNTDSSITSVKSNRKKKSRMDSSISSAKSNQRKISRGVVMGSASNTDSSIPSAKSNRKKKSQSVVAGLTLNMDSSISSAKSNQKQRKRDVAGSASNMDSSNSSAKSSRKKKSRRVTAGSVSNSDSSINSVTKKKTKRKYCKRNENDNVSETSNESSSPSFLMLLSNNHNGEKSEISSDTSFSSVSKKYSEKDEKQTNFNFLWAMESQPRDLYSGPGCMVSTPRTNTDALSMNIDDTLRSVASNGSLSGMSESDLITFSPEINTEKQCQKGHQSVESVSTSPQLSEPDLIYFSPDINDNKFQDKSY